ncbi:ferredoxin [Solwaraspora sp. WMMD1047]|uniref:ferredoxin n=1 Tax=Solwaraspora sp. WMMD1047 TaxID=3016102 RepID=UPI002415DA96|nr:ferredoxin [Solwaraspora sp. WMMD1047]MDG4827977.1 ferredoxin [Solwaraspora sp. WMMD1047]
MSAGWRIGVDPRRCVGSGSCAGIAPAHFTLIDGLATPLTELVEPADEVIDAADVCPVEAITVRDSAGERVAPGA